MCMFIYIQREGGKERNRKHTIGEERGLWERKPQHSLYIPYTLSLSITDQENLAKNILRCFHTKEFWNTLSHLKSHTSSIPCMAKIRSITSKNETLRQNVSVLKLLWTTLQTAKLRALQLRWWLWQQVESRAMSVAEKLEMQMQIQEERRIKMKERIQTDPGNKLHPRKEAFTAYTRITPSKREHLWALMCARHRLSTLQVSLKLSLK